ncbi:MAG: non-hydrolyzing UDP-N-acetylglucosamine 2-epimerase [Limnochordia bacterium]
MQKIMMIFGTRPEGIKMAPLYHALKKGGRFLPCVAVTGQHREMLHQVLELFQIPADYDLDIMQPGQSLTEITSRVLGGLEGILKEAQPDLVLVHGDTTTTFSASLAAFYQQIPVGHVEAGLRSYDPYNPYPEEMNRRLTAQLARLHFSPTPQARENLLGENIDPESIFITGNTVIDALLGMVEPAYPFQDPQLAALDFMKKIMVVTLHRRENWGQPLENILAALRAVMAEEKDVEMVFSLHKNPRVREPVRQYLGGQPRVHLIEPPHYREFANLLARSYLVVTDSGGLQEEAPALGKPVLVLRETTERPEGLEAGTVRLLGTEERHVYQGITQILRDPREYAQMAQAINPYGDGQAALRIAQILHWYFQGGELPPEFQPGR